MSNIGAQKIQFFSNSAAGTSAQFVWRGGHMAFMAEATFGGGSVKLQALMPNGTAADVGSSTLSANGMAILLNLPPGIYQAVAATGSAFYCIGVSVPTYTI